MHKKLWIILTAVGCVLILVGGWLLLVSPQRDKVASINADTESQQSVNQGLQSKLSILQAGAAQVPAQQAQIDKIKQQIPTTPQLPTLIRSVSQAASDAGVTLGTFTPASPTDVVGAAGVSFVALTVEREGRLLRPGAVPQQPGADAAGAPRQRRRDRLAGSVLVGSSTAGSSTSGSTGSPIAGATDGHRVPERQPRRPVPADEPAGPRLQRVGRGSAGRSEEHELPCGAVRHRVAQQQHDEQPQLAAARGQRIRETQTMSSFDWGTDHASGLAGPGSQQSGGSPAEPGGPDPSGDGRPGEPAHVDCRCACGSLRGGARVVRRAAHDDGYD